MTGRELLRLHLEAVWATTLPPLDEARQEVVLTHGLPPWSLYLGAFAQQEVAVWRPNVAPEQRVLYLANARKAGDVWDRALAMRREVVFYPPRLRPEQAAQARQRARVLSAADADLINAFEPDSAAYFLNPHKAPVIGVIVAGRLVSIAHSSRQTPAACELGIETLPEARRRGHAAAATILWTTLIQQRGLVPLYSAFAWNSASLQLAQSLGYQPGIAGVYGPVAEHEG